MIRTRRLGTRVVATALGSATLTALTALVTLTAVVAPPADAGSAPSPPTGPTGTAEPALANRAARLDALDAPLSLPTDRAPQLLLAGDSVADTLVDALAAAANERGAELSRSIHPGCGLLPGVPTTLDGFTPAWAQACADASSDWRSRVAGAPADAVLVLSTWDGSPRLLDGAFVDPATPDGRATFVGLVRALVDEIAPIGSGRSVVLVAEAIPTRGTRSGDPIPRRVAEARTHRSVLRDVAQGDPTRVRVVDLGEWLCPTGAPCPELVDGVTARPNDGAHLSPEGAALVAPRLLDAVGVRAG